MPSKGLVDGFIKSFGIGEFFRKKVNSYGIRITNQNSWISFNYLMSYYIKNPRLKSYFKTVLTSKEL